MVLVETIPSQINGDLLCRPEGNDFSRRLQSSTWTDLQMSAWTCDPRAAPFCQYRFKCYVQKFVAAFFLHIITVCTVFFLYELFVSVARHRMKEPPQPLDKTTNDDRTELQSPCRLTDHKPTENAEDEQLKRPPTTPSAKLNNQKFSSPDSSRIPAPLKPDSIILHRRRLLSPSQRTSHQRHNNRIQKRRLLSEISPHRRLREHQSGGRYKLRSKALLMSKQNEGVAEGEK